MSITINVEDNEEEKEELIECTAKKRREHLIL